MNVSREQGGREYRLPRRDADHSPGSSVFLDIDLEAGVPYTLSDTSGNRPIVATFTPG